MNTTTGASVLAPLVVVVPIVTGALLLAIGRSLPRWALDAVAVAGAATVLALDAVLLDAVSGGRVVTWSGGWTPHAGATVGIALVADRIGVGAALLAAVLITCALIYSWRYYEDAEAHFHVMLLLFLAGMTGFALSADLFDMLVFFELMGALAYALTGFRVEAKAAVQGGLNFAIVNSFGAFMTLTGIGMLYSRTGQLGLAQLSEALAGHRADALVVAAFVLVCTGWLVKAAAAPFHFWTADAEAVAPSPVCAVFSGVMVVLGVYGVARVYWTVFADALPEGPVRRGLLAVGILTAVLGGVMAVAQRNLKRLLAYATIAHVGLFLIAVGVLSSDGVAGAATYAAGHAGVEGSLFLLAGIVLNRYRSVDELELHGRGQPGSVLAWLMVLDGLCMAGLPPFGVGLGKGMCEDALSHEGFGWGPYLFVAVSALTGGAVLRATGRIFFGFGAEPTEEERQGSARQMSGEDDEETEGRLHRVPASMLIAVLVLMAGGLTIGTVPGFGRVMEAAAERFVDTHGYVDQVLHGIAPVPLHPADTWWTLAGVLLDVLSTAFAIGVAAVGLHFRRLPGRLRSPVTSLRPVLDGLRTLHSGHVGDYLAWLVVGVSALLAIVGLPVLA
ncbi:MAG TPA: proton-conducting transporter membrane subunit [Jatrophihabitans sp.]|nr:proton-conducting transporter membrane subunit [Jatrophihabitans sp.]